MRRLGWFLYCAAMLPLGAFAFAGAACALVIGCFLGLMIDCFHRGTSMGRFRK